MMSRFFALLLAIGLILVTPVKAQTAYSDPFGFTTITAVAGTGTTRTISVLSFPLLDSPQISGQSAGRITGITANSITNSNASWTAGELSNAATPLLVKITSGQAVGRTFLISNASPNNATTVTIDGEEAGKVNLTKIGIVTGTAGDTYSIVACDTLAGILGTPSTTGVLGATTPTAADQVQIFVSGAWRQYYYSTSGTGNWRRVGPNTISDNLPIRPDTGVIYSRLGVTPVKFTITGNAPVVERKANVADSGVTVISTSWPVGLTLATSNISSIPGWVASNSSANADIVELFVLGAWRQYYFNGTDWKRVGPNTTSNSVALSLGSAAILLKRGSANSTSTLSQPIPY